MAHLRNLGGTGCWGGGGGVLLGQEPQELPETAGLCLGLCDSSSFVLLITRTIILSLASKQ